ncbi:MAG: PIN domain-containing protein [Caulobacteraceae bacterium]
MTARVAFDTNILVYAELEPESDKGERAIELTQVLAPRMILAAQVALEFLAVVRRRAPEDLPRALDLVAWWRATLALAPTTDGIFDDAAGLIRSHRFQVWDAVIWTASRAAGARFLLSEDMHDGLELGGLTAINPFKRDMAELLALIGR